jgi:hypothetical protein
VLVPKNRRLLKMLSLVIWALPAVLAPRNCTVPLLVMVALPAVLLLLKVRKDPEVLVMIALPAVLVLRKERAASLRMVALPAVLALMKFRKPELRKSGRNINELLTMPMPVMLKVTPGLIKNTYCGAPASNCIVWIEARESIIGAVSKGPKVKVAVLSGTSGFEVQLAPLFHMLLKAPVQVASVACAGVTLAPIANNTAKARARLTNAAIMVAPPRSVHAARRQFPQKSSVAVNPRLSLSLKQT